MSDALKERLSNASTRASGSLSWRGAWQMRLGTVSVRSGQVVGLVLLLLTAGVPLPGSDGSLSGGASSNLFGSLGSYVLNGNTSAGWAGWSVAPIGDFDGDGYDDFAVGAPGDLDGFALAAPGHVEIVFGRGAPMETPQILQQAAAADGLRLTGLQDKDQFGRSLAALGDFDGDGFDDFAVGAPNHKVVLKNGAGRVYVIRGGDGDGNGADIDAEAADIDTNTFHWDGLHADDRVGFSVSGAGDVTRDGRGELLVGAPGYSTPPVSDDAGVAYLIDGQSWNDGGVGDGGTIDSVVHSEFRGVGLNGHFGNTTAGWGDYNKDGLLDVVIGAPDLSPLGTTLPGRIYVYYGSNDGWGAIIGVGLAGDIFDGLKNDHHLGWSLANIGDTDGDQYDDLLVGMYGVESDTSDVISGEDYLLLGQDRPWRGEGQDIGDVAMPSIIAPQNSLHIFGFPVGAAGDLSGDTWADIAVAALSEYDIGCLPAAAEQTTYVRAGTDQLTNTVQMASLTPSYKENCVNRPKLAPQSVASAGDFDGDGVDELLLGGWSSDAAAPNGGAAYLLNPGSNSEPSQPSDLKFYADPAYSIPVSWADVGHRVYIQLDATDPDALNANVARLRVRADEGVWHTIRAYETGHNTGRYRTYLDLQSWTDLHHHIMGVAIGQTLRVEVEALSNGVGHTISIGPLGLGPLPWQQDATEDQPFLLGLVVQNATAPLVDAVAGANWLTFDASNWTVGGTPDNAAVGGVSVNVTVTDAFDVSVLRTYLITVHNEPPAVIGPLVAPDAVQDVPYSLDLNSTDDGQGTITWVIDQGPAWLSIDGAGRLNGTPSNGDVGMSDLNVSVDDGNGGIDTWTAALTVLNVNDPPTVLTTVMPDVVDEDSLLLVTLQGSDPDLDDTDLVWNLSGGDPWLSIGPENGTLTGTPSNADVGAHELSVTLTDRGGATDTRDWTLQVRNVNDLPTFISSPPLGASVGAPYEYKALVEEVDLGDTVNFSLSSPPAGMTVDRATGFVQWAPDPTQVGPFGVTIVASDGHGATEQVYEVVVRASGGPPLAQLLAPKDTQVVNTLTPSLSWSGSDPDNDELTYDVYLSSSRAQSGTLAGIAVIAENITETFITLDPLTPNATYYWTVIPSDGTAPGSCAQGVWSFSIAADATINAPPRFLSEPPLTALIGATYSYDVAGDDPEGIGLTFALEQGPDGMTLTASGEQGAQVRWVPQAGQQGTVQVVLLLSDDATTITQGFSIRVGDSTNSPPTVTLDSPEDGEVLQTTIVQLRWSLTDVDGTLLNSTIYLSTDQSLVERHHEISQLTVLSQSKNQYRLPIPLKPTIVYYWTIVVDDGVFVTPAPRVFSFTIDSKATENHPPTAIGPAVVNLTVDKGAHIQLLASDHEHATLTFALSSGPPGLTVWPGGELVWTPHEENIGITTVRWTVSDGLTTTEGVTVLNVRAAGRGDPNDPVVFHLSTLPVHLSGLLALLAAVAIGAILALLLVGARRKRRSSGAEGSATSGGVSGGSGASGAAAAGAASMVVPMEAAASDEVDPFHIASVLVMLDDGRLIISRHAPAAVGSTSAPTSEELMPEELLSSMLVAIRSFVRESFKTEAGLQQFAFDRYQVVLRASGPVLMAVLVEGTPPPALEESIDRTLLALTTSYGAAIATWDGDLTLFSGAGATLEPIFALEHQLAQKAVTHEVRLRSGLEFFQGYVRLKVAVLNDTSEVVTDCELQVRYDRQYLFLDRVEPALERDGSTVLVGTVSPGGKKTVAFFLDPQICQETALDATLFFKDAKGEAHHVAMKRRHVDVVCPVFYTPSTINSAILRRLLSKATEQDVRTYQPPAGTSLMDFYSRVKGVLEGFHISLVRELTQDDAPHGVVPTTVAWYYGVSSGSQEEIVLSVATDPRSQTVSVTVATSNVATLTGLLAELHHRISAAISGARPHREAIEGLTERSMRLLQRVDEAELEVAE